MPSVSKEQAKKITNTEKVYKVSESPYRHFNKPGKSYVIPHFVDHYDFQINDETDQLEVIKTDTSDIDAEVQSHADEVGIINVIKLATSMGVDPSSAPFAKKEPGFTLLTEDIQTFDDINRVKSDSNKQLEDLAKNLNISKDELVDNISKGTYNALVDLIAKNNQVKEPDGGDK